MSHSPALKIGDSFLWLSIGIFVLVTVKTVSIGLEAVVKATEVKDSSERASSFPVAAEDAICLDSLKVLASCNNVDVRQAATKLLCDRFLKNVGARKLLSADIESGDHEIQERARKVVRLLMDNATSHQIGRLTNDPRLRESPHLRAIIPPSSDVRLRPVEESPEERSLRRRRREAMVLNEGGPVSQENIIQRHSNGTRT